MLLVQLRMPNQPQCDIKKERTGKKGKENNINYYFDYHRMLKNEEIDIVIILVESGKHTQIFKDISMYKKHIIVEKSMTLNKKEMKEVFRTIQEAGMPYLVGFNRRFSKYAVVIKKYIKKE